LSTIKAQVGRGGVVLEHSSEEGTSQIEEREGDSVTGGGGGGVGLPTMKDNNYI